MQQVVNFELKFRNDNFLAAEFVLELDQFILKFDSELPFVV